MDRIVLVREAEMKTMDLVSTIQVARSFIIHYAVDYSLQMAAPMLCLHYSSAMIYIYIYIFVCVCVALNVFTGFRLGCPQAIP